jgi:hypothetical protein
MDTQKGGTQVVKVGKWAKLSSDTIMDPGGQTIQSSDRECACCVLVA